MATKRNTFLIIDDSKLHHRIYDLVLSSGKFANSRVIHAMDGREGYAILVSEPDISLIFLDINMPIMNGLEFLKKRQAEKVRLNVPVVLVTTESTEQDKARGLSAGADDYLCKPFSPEDLEKTASKFLKQSD